MPEQFTDSAKQALKLARQTAVACHHSYIGSEHLLLGLVKEPRGTAAVILKEFQVEETKLMELIDQLIDGSEAILSGNAPFTEEEMRGNRIRVYNMGYATFLCDPE